jgi:competence protein ComEC
MKLPALWIALSFACGIAVAASGAPSLPRVFFAIAIAVFGAAALASLRFRAMRTAWIFSLELWLLLGILAATLERDATPPTNVGRQMDRGQLDSADPLRWRGVLREDPAEFPWGRRYEIAMSEVEFEGHVRAVSGGLRANLYQPQKGQKLPPETLRAGDRVEALVKGRPPRNYLDPGAFDARTFLSRQGVDVIGTLRSADLLQRLDSPPPGLRYRLARWRGALLHRVDSLFATQPDRAAILRAMLLGDRSFVDSDTATAFQRTGAYHVLVVAGLHVAALAYLVFWATRRLRIPRLAQVLLTLAVLLAYAAIVQDRVPILRAVLVGGFFLAAGLMWRRVELLNGIGVAALLVLLWRPSELADASFQLSFLAAGVIAGIAVPWIERTSLPRRAALDHLGDVSRDGAYPPKLTQMRIDLRSAARWLAQRLPTRVAQHAELFFTWPCRAALRVWEIALLSFVLQLGMLPMMAHYFHRVTLSGPVSNIPAVLLTGVIVPVGFLALGATFVSARLAGVFAKFLSLLTAILLACVERFAHVHWLSYRIPGPPLWLDVAFLLGLIALAMASRAAARRLRARAEDPEPASAPPGHATWTGNWVECCAAVALAGLVVLVATHPFRPNLKPHLLEITVLDVGQGDSIFAAFPDGRTILIDGGGQAGAENFGGYHTGIDVGEQVVSPYLWSRGIKRIDVVALTHAHHDHIDGLHAVFNNFAVGQLWLGRDEATPPFEALLEEANHDGATVVRELAGNSIDLGGVNARVLWPQDPSRVATANNNNSLVLRLTDGNQSFMLSGDIEKKVEAALVSEKAPLRADFLKVPHHGSKTSSTDPFLEAVQPKIAVISVGESNSFGHASPEILNRYQQRSVRTYRTDRDGAVSAWTDGNFLKVQSFAEASNGVQAHP